MEPTIEPEADPKHCVDPSLIETTSLPAAVENATVDLPDDIDPYRTIAPSGDVQAAPLRMIGRYTVLGKLGSGGQADVFRAVHPTLPIEVAIKLSHGKLDDRVREALRDEAHILCDLDHPQIAKIRDFDFANGQPFMVLDFIRGRSLAQVADAQPYSPVDAAKLVAKIARAIGFANARGVIHRDLKPENVVIDGNGEPKIIDFGMSRLRSALGGTAMEANEVSGTLAYMAPEQAQGITSKTDHRVDIFALGAILYRLLVGTPPYSRLPFIQLIERVREGIWDRKALDEADGLESIHEIVRQSMRVNPADRFETAESLADAVDAALAPTPEIRSLISNFNLIHIGNNSRGVEFSGSLSQFRSPMVEDDIQVNAEFSQPVYCFLIALNPDGTKQLCYPNHPLAIQSMPISNLRFPENEASAFGLTDGTGIQAFMLLTSRKPLPAYEQWNGELKDASWPPSDAIGEWIYMQGKLQSVTHPVRNQHRVSRGVIRAMKQPTAFKQLCDTMHAPGVFEVNSVLFEVQTRSKTI